VKINRLYDVGVHAKVVASHHVFLFVRRQSAPLREAPTPAQLQRKPLKSHSVGPVGWPFLIAGSRAPLPPPWRTCEGSESAGDYSTRYFVCCNGREVGQWCSLANHAFWNSRQRAFLPEDFYVKREFWTR
jgi:hypothetical protein